MQTLVDTDAKVGGRSLPGCWMRRFTRSRVPFRILVATVVGVGIGAADLRVRNDAIAAGSAEIFERRPAVTIHGLDVTYANPSEAAR